jgi:hypothetical protein
MRQRGCSYTSYRTPVRVTNPLLVQKESNILNVVILIAAYDIEPSGETALPQHPLTASTGEM